MRYEKSDRIQNESYCCPVHFLEDAIETLFDESLETKCIHIISDKYLTETLLKLICQTTINDFEFELSLIDFNKENDEIDEYRITIFDDGEVYIEPAIDEDGEYYDCDGFIFAECEVSEDAYNGNNRGNDTMIFSIESDYE
jgi:hypothetical protein